MSAIFDLEIHALLNEYSDPSVVADILIKNIEASSENLIPENIYKVSHFLWHANLHTALVDFVLRNLENESFAIPWPFLAEAIKTLNISITPELQEALLKGIEETNSMESFAQSTSLDEFITQAQQWRIERKYKIHKKYLDDKFELLDQVATLRAQQLLEQEKALLIKMQSIYPGDSDVENEMREFKQRNALEVLAKRIPKNRQNKTELSQQADSETEAMLAEIFRACQLACDEYPEMAYDLSILLATFGSYANALKILTRAKNSKSKDWLELELLLLNRRFLDLLEKLDSIENKYAKDPETFFATTYLRAQAMHGLGQNNLAIEILEGLLNARPHYRSAQSLRNEWGLS